MEYKTETRYDGNGQPYQVRIPIAPNKSITTNVARTPLEVLDSNPNIANNPTTTNSPNTLSTTTINPFSSTDLDYAKALDEKMALDAIDKNKQVLSEDEYKAEALKSLQAEIDAQNSLYAGKLSRAKMEGVDRLGQEGAIQARRGLLGSDFGTSSTNKIITANTDIQNSIENELALKLEEIRAGARKSGTEKYEAARRAKQEGLDAYITDLQNRGTLNKSIASKIASQFLQGDIDPNKDANYLDEVAKSAGITSESIKSAYVDAVEAKKEADTKAQKEQADLEKVKADTIKTGLESGRYYEVGGKIYDKNNNFIGNKYEKPTGDGSLGTYVAGENPVVDSWAERIQNGTAKITEIPASQVGLRNAVTVALQAMGNSTEGKPTTTELGKAALANAKGLLEKLNSGVGTSAVGASRAVGGGLLANIPGSNPFGFKNDFNAIKSQLSLEGVKYLKGQGQVSDAERALLAQAVTKLNLSQSESEFKSTLQGIIDKLEGNVQSDNFSVTDPQGNTHTFNSQADLDAFKKAAGL